MIYQKQLASLNHVTRRHYGPVPENQVTSLETLRKYIGPQSDPVPPPNEMEAPDYWHKRGEQEALFMARGTFVRFASNLSGLTIPADSSEGRIRDELLAVLAGHGYTR